MGRTKRKRYLFDSEKAKLCQAISTQSRRQRSEQHARLQAEEAQNGGSGGRYNFREGRATSFICDSPSDEDGQVQNDEFPTAENRLSNNKAQIQPPVRKYRATQPAAAVAAATNVETPGSSTGVRRRQAPTPTPSELPAPTRRRINNNTDQQQQQQLPQSTVAQLSQIRNPAAYQGGGVPSSFTSPSSSIQQQHQQYGTNISLQTSSLTSQLPSETTLGSEATPSSHHSPPSGEYTHITTHDESLWHQQQHQYHLQQLQSQQQQQPQQQPAQIQNFSSTKPLLVPQQSFLPTTTTTNASTPHMPASHLPLSSLPAVPPSVVSPSPQWPQSLIRHSTTTPGGVSSKHLRLSLAAQISTVPNAAGGVNSAIPPPPPSAVSLNSNISTSLFGPPSTNTPIIATTRHPSHLLSNPSLHIPPQQQHEGLPPLVTTTTNPLNQISLNPNAAGAAGAAGAAAVVLSPNGLAISTLPTSSSSSSSSSTTSSTRLLCTSTTPNPTFLGSSPHSSNQQLFTMIQNAAAAAAMGSAGGNGLSSSPRTNNTSVIGLTPYDLTAANMGLSNIPLNTALPINASQSPSITTSTLSLFSMNSLPGVVAGPGTDLRNTTSAFSSVLAGAVNANNGFPSATPGPIAAASTTNSIMPTQTPQSSSSLPPRSSGNIAAAAAVTSTPSIVPNAAISGSFFAPDNSKSLQFHPGAIPLPQFATTTTSSSASVSSLQSTNSTINSTSFGATVGNPTTSLTTSHSNQPPGTHSITSHDSGTTTSTSTATATPVPLLTTIPQLHSSTQLTSSGPLSSKLPTAVARSGHHTSIFNNAAGGQPHHQSQSLLHGLPTPSSGLATTTTTTASIGGGSLSTGSKSQFSTTHPHVHSTASVAISSPSSSNNQTIHSTHHHSVGSTASTTPTPSQHHLSIQQQQQQQHSQQQNVSPIPPAAVSRPNHTASNGAISLSALARAHQDSKTSFLANSNTIRSITPKNNSNLQLQAQHERISAKLHVVPKSDCSHINELVSITIDPVDNDTHTGSNPCTISMSRSSCAKHDGVASSSLDDSQHSTHGNMCTCVSLSTTHSHSSGPCHSSVKSSGSKQHIVVPVPHVITAYNTQGTFNSSIIAPKEQQQQQQHTLASRIPALQIIPFSAQENAALHNQNQFISQSHHHHVTSSDVVPVGNPIVATTATGFDEQPTSAQGMDANNFFDQLNGPSSANILVPSQSQYQTHFGPSSACANEQTISSGAFCQDNSGPRSALPIISATSSSIEPIATVSTINPPSFRY